jgi:type VI secretion system protein ImpK
MDRVNEATEAVFNALAQLREADAGAVPMPELVHQQLAMYIEQAARSAARAGFTQQDADDIRYALTALTDEIVLQQEGALREFWMPRLLQLRFFNENVAGEAFFTRLADLRRDPARADVLRVYYMCLLFGFQGRYRVRGGQIELADITDRVKEDLTRARQLVAESNLSPHGARPYEPIADAHRNNLLVWLSIAAATASLVLYVWLKLDLAAHANQLVERLTQLSEV